MKEKSFISFVIHAHSAQGRIGIFLLKLDSVLSKSFENYEIVLVDNGSRDGTASEAMGIARELRGAFSLLKLDHKRSVDAAIMAGTDKSMGDFVYELESIDVDFPLSTIMDLFCQARKGHDVVALVPDTEEPLPTRLFYTFFQRISHSDTRLMTERLTLSSRRAINSLVTLEGGIPYRKVLFARTGFRKKSLRYHPVGNPMINPRDFREKAQLAADVLISYSDIAAKAGGLFSLVFFLFSIGCCFYAVLSFLYAPNLNRGWTSLMIFLSLSFSGVFLLMGIIGGYARQILAQLQKRPAYFVQEYFSKGNAISQGRAQAPAQPEADQEIGNPSPSSSMPSELGH